MGFHQANTDNKYATINTSLNTVTTSGGATTNSYTTGQNIAELHSTTDGSRRIYTFTPPAAPTAPTNLTYSNVTQTSMTLNWTDSPDETGYLIYSSTDNINFSLLTASPLLAGTTSYNHTSLTHSTTYYHRVVAINEGAISSFIEGNQATQGPLVRTSTGTGNWNTATTWSPNGVPTTLDSVVIADGHTVTIDVNAICAKLTVGQGTSGTLTFDNIAGVRNITINNSLTVATGATFDAGNQNKINTIYLGGNSTTTNYGIGTGSMTINGTLDLYTGASSGKGTITFFGNIDASISGTGSIDFNNTNILNKGNANITIGGTPPILELLCDYTVQGASTLGFIATHTAGILKIGETFTQSNPVYVSAAYSIPALGGFWLDNPNFTVLGLTGNQTNNGLLKITNGTFNIGTTTNNAMGGGSNAIFTFEGGTTNIASRLNTATICNLTISNGTINVTTVENSTTTASGFGFTNASNTISISGGTINLVQRSTGTTKFDYYINGSSINITGGTLNIGTPATATNYDFSVFGQIPNFVIDNTTNNKTARIIDASTIHGTVTINSGTTLNLITGTLTLKSTITNNGTFTANNSGANAIQFQGSAAQTLNGTITSNQINGLIIDNNAGITITPSVQINSALTLTQGALTCGGTLTLGNGTTSSFTFINSGGSIVGTPTLNYGTGTNNFTYNGTTPQTTGLELPATVATGTLTINNSAGVTLNSALNIQNIVLTNGVLTTTATNLITATNTAVGGVTRTNGYINGPLVRKLPASLGSVSTYTWPLGKSEYTPFELINATTSAGTGIFINAEVFDLNCGGTSGTGIGTLNTNRYWESSIIAGTSTLSNTTVKITDASIVSTKALGQASAIDGAYNFIGATQSGTTLTSNLITTLGFFVIGNKKDLSGTFDVGTSQPILKKLTNIANELNNSIVAGNVIYELNSDYDGTTGETFPITFNQYLTSGGNWTVTIRVKSEAGMRTTSGISATQLIKLNGVDSLIFDGREGGVDSTKAWTFLNTNTSGTTFTFINDAVFNTIKHCNIRSVNSSAASGTIVFSTGTTTGNDNNRIDNCDIYDGATTPTTGIYSLGTATKENSDNTVSNCNIYNFFSAGSTTNGILISTNNTNWTIDGNRFYQTATRTYTTGNIHYIIQINSTSGNNFAVNNNIIGYSANNGTGTYTLAGSTTTRIAAISLNVGTSSASSIQNNTITNFQLSTTSGGGAGLGTFCGIYIPAGSVNIGNETGNIIGGNSTDVIKTIRTTGAGTGTLGISSTSTATVVISNNTIAGLTDYSTTAGNAGAIRGIIATGTAGNYTINNNTIGSISVANCMRAGTAGTTTGATYAMAIENSATGTINITNNTIANFVSNGTNASSIIRGISSTSGTNNISNNTVMNLSTSSSNTGTLASASVIGISMTSTTAGTTLSQNTIYELNNSNTAASAKSVIGIHFSGYINASLSVNHLIDKNNIHSLNLSSPTSSHIIGINLTQGRTVTVQNNMIRLGISSAGDITGPHQIRGIEDTHNTNNFYNYYNNSVFIGGTGVTGSAATYAINSLSTNVRNIQNNIFVNNRSNGTGTGKHYAIKVAGTTMNPAGLTMDNNIYYTSGTGGILGYFNSADVSNINYLRRVVGQNIYSGYGYPNFVNANTAIPDLHVQSPTPAEGSGVQIATISDDFDSELRSSSSPNDIGADAGSYTHADIFSPIISFTSFNPRTGSTDNRILSVSISDFTGVPTSGVNQPRIWYRKSSGTPSSWASTAGTLQSGSATNGTWNFTIDYTQVPITPAINDIFQYYVVAQDEATTPNIITDSITGVHTDVNTQTLAPLSINSYTISRALSGTYNLGSGEAFTSITGASPNGLFAEINNGVVVGDITINITSDITEPGTNSLSEWFEEGSGNYSIILQPNDATTKTIKAHNIGSSLFKFYGADRVTIDGGVGKNLRLQNTNATINACKPVIEFNQGSTNCAIKNCSILNNAWSSSVILFGTTGSNNNILIEGNQIGTLDTVTDKTNNEPSRGIASITNTNNKLITIKNNNIFNFFQEGIYLEVGDSCTITGNSLYRTLAPYNMDITGIGVRYGNGHIISGNYIGGTLPNCGGDTMRVRDGMQAIFIREVGTTAVTKIENNTIQNMNISGESVVRSELIYIFPFATKLLIKGNTIGHKIVANSVMQSKYTTATMGGGSYIFAIRNGSTDPNTIIDSNTIANITFDADIDMESIYGINTNNGNVTRNKIYKLGSSNGIHSLAIRGIEYTSSAPVGTGEVSNNMVSLGTKGLDDIAGIWDWTSNNHIAKYIYNSVYIYGTASASFSSINSAFCKNETQNEPVMNNIFINTSTGGTGSVRHLAYEANSAAYESNYNLLMAPDASKALLWEGINQDFSTWRYEGRDISSWFYMPTSGASDYASINPSNLFIDPENGDLRINTSNPEAWCVYGKGVAGNESENITYDYTDATRGTTYGYGTCIGAHQFGQPSVAPISANETGTLATGNSTTYTLGGRTICSIDWISGTAPTAMDVQYFSGCNPPNRQSGIKYHNYYVKCDATGGSGYTYDMNLRFDKAFYSNLTELPNTGLAKYSSSWIYDVDGAPVNIAGPEYILSNTGYTEFSNFTGSEKGLLLPITLIDFSGERLETVSNLHWSTASETNNNYFEVLRSTDLVNFEVVGTIKGAGNSNILKEYIFNDSFPKSLQNSIIYYQLKQVDFDQKSSQSKIIALNPNNNLQNNQIINVWMMSSGEIMLDYQAMYNSSISIQLVDGLGQIVYQSTYIASEGVNHFTISNQNKIKPGVYIVRIFSNNGVETKKINIY